ncbi:MAG: hypothetical protein AB7S38_28700 [Vulcanimicrobiota bacterium]
MINLPERNPSTYVDRKADRLIRSDQVHRVNERHFIVQGDTGVYNVRSGRHGWWCECDYRGRWGGDPSRDRLCSHIEASLRVLNRVDPPNA